MNRRWIIVFLLLTQGASADVVLYHEGAVEAIWAGQSEDGRFYSIVQPLAGAAPRAWDIRRYDRQTGIEQDVGLGFELFGGRLESDLSGDGRRQVLIVDANGEPSLRLYDFGTDEQFIFSHLDVTGLVDPRFVHQTDEVILSRPESGFRSLGLTELVIASSTGVEIVTPPTVDRQPVGRYYIRAFDVSDDGNDVVMSTLDGFVAGDCCFFNPGFVAHLDRAEGAWTIVRDSTSFIDLDLSADGDTLAMALGDGAIVLRDLDTGSEQVIETEFSNVSWLRVDRSSRRLFVKANAPFSDGRSRSFDATVDSDSGFMSSLSTVPRPAPIIALDLELGAQTIVNRLSNTQMLTAQPIELTAGEDGVVYSSRLRGQSSPLERDVIISTPARFEFVADAAISGLWFDPAQEGQGFSVQMVPDVNEGPDQVVVFWYTFDAAGQPLWLIIQSPLVENAVDGTARRWSASGSGPTQTSADAVGEAWGTVRIEFLDCQRATVNYDSVEFGAGTLSLVRLAYQSGLGCL